MNICVILVYQAYYHKTLPAFIQSTYVLFFYLCYLHQVRELYSRLRHHQTPTCMLVNGALTSSHSRMRTASITPFSIERHRDSERGTLSKRAVVTTLKSKLQRGNTGKWRYQILMRMLWECNRYYFPGIWVIRILTVWGLWVIVWILLKRGW